MRFQAPHCNISRPMFNCVSGTVWKVCAYFKLTITFNEQKGGIMTSDFIMSLAVIVSSKLRCDIRDGVVLP